MRQIPKHSISLQIFLLAQLFICYEKRCALELYLSNQPDLMLSNINILCFISTIITLEKKIKIFFLFCDVIWSAECNSIKKLYSTETESKWHIWFWEQLIVIHII